MDRKDSFWMSMVKKYEKRNYDLDEQKCTLRQRLETLKYKISSTHQSLKANSSVSCCCCANSQSSLSSSSNGSVPNVSSSSFPKTKICPYKPQTSVSSVNCCDKPSMDSMELQYISKLHDLINREKQMKQKVKNMAIREKAFVETLKRADQLYSSMESKFKKRLSQEERSKNSKYEKMTKELLDENSCLCDQLQDAKLELKQCMEKLQGPIARQMEQERRRSTQLENELKLASQEMENKDCCYNKDVCTLQNKLAETTENLSAINALNDMLQEQMCSLSRKYKELQNDLINQKINEAHTLERLNEMIAEKEREPIKPPVSNIQTQFSSPVQQVNTVSDNLYEIARKLSSTMAAIDQCPNCAPTVPQDLKGTMLGIVVIADLVDQGCKNNKSVTTGDDFNDKDLPPSGDRGGTNEDNDTTDALDKQPLSGDDGEVNQNTEDAGNEPPVNDVDQEEPTKLDIENGNNGGTIDEDTYAAVESLSSGSFSRGKSEIRSDVKEKIERLLNKEKGKLCRETEIMLARPEAGDVQVMSQVETANGLQILVETAGELYEKDSDHINVLTTFTASGMLEVVTEGPAGIIETTMMLTPSGSIELITRIVDFPEDLENSEMLSIAPTAIREKISGAIVKDGTLPEFAKEESLSFVDSLSIALTDEINEPEPDSLMKLPPAEPLEKKLKESADEFDVSFEQIGGGEVEEFKVEIEITEPPVENKLMSDEEKAEYYSTELRKKVELVMKNAHKNVVDALDKVNQEVAEALVKANQDVEFALATVLSKEPDYNNKWGQETGVQEVELPFLGSCTSFTHRTGSTSTTFNSAISGTVDVYYTMTFTSENGPFECTLAELEEPVLSSETLMEGGDAIKSVCDFVTDSLSENSKNGIKKAQAEATPKSVMARTVVECDCGLCLCDQCSPKVMKNRSGKNFGDVSQVYGEPHPPDCDCVDCLCKPCASFPKDYKTRVHPPGCDCIDCLCTKPPCAGETTAGETTICETTARRTAAPQTIAAETTAAPQTTAAETTAAPQTTAGDATSVQCGTEPTNEKEVDANMVEERSQNQNVNLPHSADCECELCKCCRCEKGKKPCGPCDQESHLSTCTCIDCLLTCGIRRNVTEKIETNPECVCEKCDKTCDTSCTVADKCAPVEKDTPHGFDCDCSACKLACGDECDMLIKKKISSNAQDVETTVNYTKSRDECDCLQCKDICDNPTCAKILKAEKEMGIVQKDDKMKKELKDLQACLDRINCACAEAEDKVCKPLQSKSALMVFRSVVENLQEKCKEKDKVISAMIKEMKSRMDRNVFCNLLGLTSKQSEGSQSVCSCNEDRTKVEDISKPYCQRCAQKRVCPFDHSESSGSTSSSCCTEFEEEVSLKNSSSDDICSCFFLNTTQTKSCMTDVQDRREHVRSSNVRSISDSTCPYCQEKCVGPDPKKAKMERKPTKRKDTICGCYPESNKLESVAEPQRMWVCTKPDAVQRESKIAIVTIVEMRKIADALLVKWSKACCKNLVGYEVLVDGQIKSKIRSPDRTCALIYSVTSKKPVTVTVYALTPEGRCLPAAKAVFDV